MPTVTQPAKGLPTPTPLRIAIPASPVATVPAPAEATPPAVLADLLARRRTVRRLTDGPLAEEALERIAAAADRVPAAYNRPVWRVVLLRERRDAFWAAVEAGFRDRLEPDRLSRYLDRLAGFRGGAGALLVYEDRREREAIAAGNGLTPEQAAAFAEQGLGMVQLALWLALVAEGLAASLQHWDGLIEDRLDALLGMPRGRFRLVATMPFGFPAEDPAPSAAAPPVACRERFPIEDESRQVGKSARASRGVEKDEAVG